MERRVPTVAELVRRAVEACDPEDSEQNLARLEEQLEDDEEPVTAVENLEERLAIAAEGADYEIEDPAVSVATRWCCTSRPSGAAETASAIHRSYATGREGAVAPGPAGGRRGVLADRGVRV